MGHGSCEPRAGAAHRGTSRACAQRITTRARKRGLRRPRVLWPFVYLYRADADWRRRQRVLNQRGNHGDVGCARLYRTRTCLLPFFFADWLSDRIRIDRSSPFSQLRWLFRRLVTQPGSGPADQYVADRFLPYFSTVWLHELTCGGRFSTARSRRAV